MKLEDKLGKAYLSYKEECELSSIEEAKEVIVKDWGEGALRGYAVFWDDHYTPKDTGFECINRIDDMSVYYGDYFAAKQAEQDGFCKIIRDIRIPKEMDIYPLSGTIIDNKENRTLLESLISEYKELKKPRYAYFIYRKSDGELICESDCTVEEMPVKKSEAKKLAKEELDKICRAFNDTPDNYEIEIEGNHYLM